MAYSTTISLIMLSWCLPHFHGEAEGCQDLRQGTTTIPFETDRHPAKSRRKDGTTKCKMLIGHLKDGRNLNTARDSFEPGGTHHVRSNVRRSAVLARRVQAKRQRRLSVIDISRAVVHPKNVTTLGKVRRDRKIAGHLSTMRIVAPECPSYFLTCRKHCSIDPLRCPVPGGTGTR